MKIRKRFLLTMLLTLLLTMSMVFAGCGKREIKVSDTPETVESAESIGETETQTETESVETVSVETVSVETETTEDAEVTEEEQEEVTADNVDSDEIVYENTQYGFEFSLPNTWKVIQL